MPRTREEMAAAAASELQPNMAVNLGIGIPTLVANYVPDGMPIWLHSENGILGMGPFPYDEEVDPQIINAGKQTVTVVPGGSFFDSATSFGMIRGGHVDLAILGGMQVAQNGDLANWMIPGKKVNGMGGAMDLATGAKRVIVLMTHNTRKGGPKLLTECELPLTGQGCVSRVVTDIATLDITERGFVLADLAPGHTLEEVREKTGAPVHSP
jgi:3-oxoacid CoA-transferase subunit B